LSGLLIVMAEDHSPASFFGRVPVPLLVVLAGVVAVIVAAPVAWPVGVLELAMLVGLWRAFRRMNARLPDREWLVLDSVRARHCLARRDGSIDEWTAPRRFIRLRHASRALFLRDRDRRRLIGHCLTEAERRELARLVVDILKSPAGPGMVR
jgi:hypothetical protein